MTHDPGLWVVKCRDACEQSTSHSMWD